MNQQEVMQKIKELGEQISQSTHPTNSIEIALLKNKCVAMYELMQQLEPNHTYTQTTPINIVEEVKPIIEQQINHPEPETIAIPEPAEVSLFSMPKVEVKEETTIPQTEVISNEEPSIYEPLNLVPPVTTITDEPIVPTEPTIETVIETVAETVAAPIVPPTPEVVVEKHIEQPLLQDIFARSENELSLHERLTQTTPKNDINERLQSSKVESLKSAISLNKKIAFVNQLFNENTVEYAKAIDKLNASATLEEALLFFSELKHNYGWSNDNELVKELQGLIEKRFAA